MRENLVKFLNLNLGMKAKFNGKCNAWYTDTDDQIYLFSYSTVVASIDPETKKFTRHWTGWSLTTQRHINYFRTSFNLEEINKKKWESLPVDEIIILG